MITWHLIGVFGLLLKFLVATHTRFDPSPARVRHTYLVVGMALGRTYVGNHMPCTQF